MKILVFSKTPLFAFNNINKIHSQDCPRYTQTCKALKRPVWPWQDEGLKAVPLSSSLALRKNLKGLPGEA